MSRLRLGIAAAIILAVAAPAATVQAQRKKEAAAPAGAVTAKDIERGKAEAPALAQAGGLSCQVVDARFIATDAKKTNYYEIACDQGIGYIVFKAPDVEKPTLATCFEANKPTPDGKPSALACKLPGNANPDAQLAPYLAKVGRACSVEKSRYIGASPTKIFMELACQGGGAYILELDNPANVAGEARLNHCQNYQAGSAVACELTDSATQLAVVDSLMAGSGKACAIKGRRYVLSTKNGANWFEASCEDGTGYMVEQGADDKFVRAVACADADFVGGGCTMTDARAAKTEQNGLYTRLAGKAGFQCEVEQYGIFNVPNKEVVELKCSNRPDGAVVIFEGAKNTVYNCALAEVQGYRCSFTKKDTAYAQVTKDLKSLKETNCVVGNSRPMDRGTDSTVYMEGSCTDGAGSYVIGYQRGGTKPTEVLACSQAKSLGGCKFPGNN